MGLRYDPKQIRRLLRRREREGLTWAVLSEVSGVPLSTLRYYRARFEQDRREAETDPAQPSTFVELIASEAATTGVALEVVLGNGRVVRVPPDFDAGHLRRLLAALESRC